MTEKPNLIPVSRWNEFHKFPTVSALRKHIFFNTNGFVDKVIVRLGKRRLYIDEQAFFNWIDEQNIKGVV